jgi:hypothetical protein
VGGVLNCDFVVFLFIIIAVLLGFSGPQLCQWISEALVTLVGQGADQLEPVGTCKLRVQAITSRWVSLFLGVGEDVLKTDSEKSVACKERKLVGTLSLSQDSGW